MKIKIDRTANETLRRRTDLKRLSVFIEMKKELNKRLMELPAGNLKKLAKLNKLFDEIIDEEIKRLQIDLPDAIISISKILLIKKIREVNLSGKDRACSGRNGRDTAYRAKAGPGVCRKRSYISGVCRRK